MRCKDALAANSHFIMVSGRVLFIVAAAHWAEAMKTHHGDSEARREGGMVVPPLWFNPLQSEQHKPFTKNLDKRGKFRII